MHVNVLPFGVLKEWLGSAGLAVELREAATVADLLDQLTSTYPARDLRGIAVGVNAEFATAAHVLRDGDEVALLPPVSGGSAGPLVKNEPPTVELVRDWIDSARYIDNAKNAADGAAVVFDGIVRDNSRGRRTLHLDYEAYEEMALRQMRELANQALTRFAIRHVTLVHRLGRLEIGETSVLIVVAAAHRGAAFDANRWLIDTLKQTVPIWKKETFADGAVWADGEPFPDNLAINPGNTRPGDTRPGDTRPTETRADLAETTDEK